MKIQKANIINSEKHRRFVASFPCVVCGDNLNVQCCHIRSIPKLGNIGKGVRDDAFCIPMCFTCHSIQHNIGEMKFFKMYNINPILISMKLSTISPCKKVNNLKLEGKYNGKLDYQEHLRNNFRDSVR
jgi:hypothetical protein